LNSQETDKENPTIFALTEEMRLENSDPKGQEQHIKANEKHNDFCLDRRNGDQKVIEKAH